MATTYTIIEAREQITRVMICGEILSTPHRALVNNADGDKPAAVQVVRDRYDAVVEALARYSDAIEELQK